MAKKPVARFYYQGSHTHPVRRTVLIIEERADMIIGYELREGSTVRTIKEAMKVVKSYRKDRIPNWGDYSRLRMTSKTILKNPQETTLERSPSCPSSETGSDSTRVHRQWRRPGVEPGLRRFRR